MYAGTRPVISSIGSLFFFAVIAMVMFAAAPALADATVTTDKEDYLPGETVVITGSGFTGQPLVTLRVTHLPEIDPNDECAPFSHDPWVVVADGQGNFTAYWYIEPCDGPGSTFLLTADDFVFNLHAEAIFTDQAALEALRNNSNPPAWAGNNINNPNACYSEGETVPFRFFLNNLTTGNTYTFTISQTALNGTRRGFDYLTDYDLTETSAITLAGGPCGPTPLGGSICTVPSNSVAFPNPALAASYSGVIPAGSGYPLTFPLAGPRNIKFYNANNVSLSNYSFSGNNLQISVTFTATSTGAGFFWGGHLANSANWGSGNGASSVPGGINMSATNPTPNGPASQTATVNQNAISCVPPACTISCPDLQPYLSGSTHSCSTPLVNGVTYLWTVTGGTILGSNTGTSVTYTVGNGGSLTISLRTCKAAANNCPVDSCCTDCSVSIPIQACACSAPPNVTVQCGSDTSPAATGTVTCTSGCAATYSDSVTPGANCAQDHIVQKITRTWTCTAGASSSCDQIITVIDNTPPTIEGVGASQEIECPASLVFSEPTASDACSPAPTLTYADVTTTGTCPIKSIITRTWTATDACGNSSQATQTITIRDSAGPSLSGCPKPQCRVHLPK